MMPLHNNFQSFKALFVMTLDIVIQAKLVRQIVH